MAAGMSITDFFKQGEGKKNHDLLAQLKGLIEQQSPDIAKITGHMVDIVTDIANPDVDTHSFSALVADAARRLPQHSDRLIGLMVELARIEETPKAGSVMQSFREYWTEVAFQFKEPRSTDTDRERRRQEWINMNVFCAKLSATRVPALDERTRAAYPIKKALERSPWLVFHHEDIDEYIADDPEDEEYQQWREYQLEIRDVRVLNYWAPAAAEWFIIDAPGMLRMEGPCGNEQEWNATDWKGAKGWNKDRFTFWIQRFEWISKVTALDGKTRKAAEQAAESMRRAEGGK